MKKLISRILNPDGSLSIDDPAVIKSFTDNPDFPYLVSYSRTGSHWLRMIMELYFEKPSLVRAFYFKDATDFTCYHTHGMDLKLRRDNVLYLYRNPVETVYSQLCYYKEDLDDDKHRHQDDGRNNKEGTRNTWNKSRRKNWNLCFDNVCKRTQTE